MLFDLVLMLGLKPQFSFEAQEQGAGGNCSCHRGAVVGLTSSRTNMVAHPNSRCHSVCKGQVVVPAGETIVEIKARERFREVIGERGRKTASEYRRKTCSGLHSDQAANRMHVPVEKIHDRSVAFGLETIAQSEPHGVLAVDGINGVVFRKLSGNRRRAGSSVSNCGNSPGTCVSVGT